MTAKSIHGKHILLRSAISTFQHTLLNLAQPASIAGFLKSCLRAPTVYSASETHLAVPSASFAEIFPEHDQETVVLSKERMNRHGWNVKLHEEIYLSAAVRALKPLTLFEIGTFDGRTTLQLASASPDAALIYTINLPEDRFDATQNPEAFNGSRVGEHYRQSSVAGKVRQIRADSTTYDFSPYYGKIDFIFVDAAHDYEHGLADSANALKMIRPGGIIVWHDFEPYWSGLVHAICEVTHGKGLRRLAGTSMAVLRATR